MALHAHQHSHGRGVPPLGGFSYGQLSPGALVFAHDVTDPANLGGVADGARVGAWSDMGPANDTLTASGTARPIYRAPFFRGRPLLEFDVNNLEDRFMVGAVTRVCTHVLVVGKFRRPDTLRGADIAGPAAFEQYRGVVGLNGYDGLPVLTGAASLILTGRQGASTWFDVYTPTAYRLDGAVVPVATADAGLERIAHSWEIARTGTFSGGPLVVGRDRNVAGALARWRGDVRWVIGLNSPTAGDLDLIRAQAYSLTRGDVVAGAGDSLTAGYGQTLYSNHMALMDARWNGTIDVPNFAIPGAGVGQSVTLDIPTMLAGDAARLDSIPADRPHAVLFVWAGTNDAAGLRSSAQILADLWSYCDARRAAGWKVVVCTLIDRTDGAVSAFQATFDATRAAVNAGIRAAWAAHADVLLDYAADARLGANGASANAAWFQADRVHITADTYNLILYPATAAVAEALLAA